MKTTHSVYLIRGTDNATAADRFQTLDRDIAGVSLDDLVRIDLAVTDAILLRAAEQLDPDTRIEFERALATRLGDDVVRENSDDEQVD
jgi:hypothetical protein